MIKVLFVCIHNSARSQMAEAFVNRFSGGEILAYSAGLTAGTLNPVVVDVMKESGIDISSQRSKSVEDFIQTNTQVDFVVTVCDESSAQRCPVVSLSARKMHWGFEDPSSFQGSNMEIYAQTRVVRDQIKARVKMWIAKLLQQGNRP